MAARPCSVRSPLAQPPWTVRHLDLHGDHLPAGMACARARDATPAVADTGRQRPVEFREHRLTVAFQRSITTRQAVDHLATGDSARRANETKDAVGTRASHAARRTGGTSRAWNALQRTALARRFGWLRLNEDPEEATDTRDRQRPRLNRVMCQSAATPSRQEIFFPASYPRPA